MNTEDQIKNASLSLCCNFLNLSEFTLEFMSIRPDEIASKKKIILPPMHVCLLPHGNYVGHLKEATGVTRKIFKLMGSDMIFFPHRLTPNYDGPWSVPVETLPPRSYEKYLKRLNSLTG